MAYKSRVSNKYMGATFAGQVRAATTSETEDLIRTLQKDVNPTLERIYNRDIEKKKDTAKAKINELYNSGKSFDDINNEILEGKHPDLSGRYVDKVVSQESGKIAAVESIANIEQNKGKYDFKTTNLPAFYKEYLPSFPDKDGAFALGFASVFNEYKAKDAIKDAQLRNKYAEEKKIEDGAKILSTATPNNFWELTKGMVIKVPPAEGETGVRYIRTFEEANKSALLYLNNSIDTASTTADLEKIEDIIKADRGVGVGGNQLGSLYSVRQKNPKVAKLIEDYETKYRTLANAEYTQSTRARETKKRTYLTDLFNIDKSTTEGQLTFDKMRKEAINEFPSLAVTINSVAKNVADIQEDKGAVTKLELDVMRGVYNNNSAALEEEWRKYSNNPETLSSLYKQLVTAETSASSGYSSPFEEKAFTRTVDKINKIIVDQVPAVNQKYQSQKNQYVADLIQQEMQVDYLDWLKDNPKPSRLASNTEKNEWYQKQQQFFNNTYNEKIKTYSNKTWLNALAEKINKDGTDLSSDINLDDIVGEYFEDRVNDAVSQFKPYISRIESESDLNMIDRAQTLMSTTQFQSLLKQKGFEGYSTDPVKQKALAQELIKRLNIDEKDFTDDINQLNDTIKQNLTTFKLPPIETYTPLGLVEKGSSIEAQQNFFINSLEQLAGRPINKELYNKILTPDAKLNIAKAFDISSVQLDALVNEYLK